MDQKVAKQIMFSHTLYKLYRAPLNNIFLLNKNLSHVVQNYLPAMSSIDQWVAHTDAQY